MKNIKGILFAEGCVSVSVQFLFLRQIMPEVGSSVTVSSLVISIFLMALAMGYHFGGKIVDSYLDVLQNNFLIAALFLALGLSPTVTGVFFDLTGNINSYLKLALYVSLFMVPPAFLLGKTIPILSNLVKARTQGELSSSVLSISTVGNVVGTLISFFLLMALLGVGYTVVINIAVLLLIVVYINPSLKAITRSTLIFSVSLVTVIASERMSYDLTTAYGSYKVATAKDVNLTHMYGQEQRFLLTNNQIQSMYSGSDLPAPYVRIIERLIQPYLTSDTRILVAGAGGFTFGRSLESHSIDFLDIDVHLRSLAEKKLLQKPINGEFKVQDARGYFLGLDKPYGVVILDTFSSNQNIPFHLVTKEYFQLVSSRTVENGIIVINTIQRADFSDTYSQYLHNTIMKSLPMCTINDLHEPIGKRAKNEFINRVYLCHNMAGSPGIFTDRRDTLLP